MLVNLLVNVVIMVFGSLFIFFPVVTISSIPIVGGAIATALTTAVGYWNTALTILPFLVLPWNIFLWVIVPFELLLLTLKVFLGHRTPVNDG